MTDVIGKTDVLLEFEPAVQEKEQERETKGTALATGLCNVKL